MKTIDEYINEILRHVECDQADRDELAEEMRSHLLQAKEHYQLKGETEEQAIALAIADFGGDQEVGEQLQRSLFPYRKELLVLLGGGSILFAALAYLHGAVQLAEPHSLWMTIVILSGLGFLLLALFPAYMGNRKLLMNLYLAGQIPFYFLGLLIIDTGTQAYIMPLQLFGGGLILLTLTLVVLTALKTPVEKKLSKKKEQKRKGVHLFNLLAGIVIVGFAGFFLAGLLIFAGLTVYMLFPLGLIVFWALSYWWQYEAAKKNSPWMWVGAGLTVCMMIMFVVVYMR
ncbi:permease prefix domain 1-containing protein [Halalkalibacter oceani]|uniref:Permease prefix domain 1-containing protein n=1 Tax=Halalkalibacter oceani TaxID=1653776 RepID=A0A9X2DPI4_9BACI|nr:permease prefix domain 1-containing protein [Halalkalibacter oceani]MCM3713987.1 permease prefix domain 1-containing protein [Halalkalibacter oceani]